MTSPDDNPTAERQANDDRLLDKTEAIELLNITNWHLERLIRYRLIPFVKVGRLVRFRRSDLDAWIEDNRTEAV